jgi:type III secretion protein T
MEAFLVNPGDTLTEMFRSVALVLARPLGFLVLFPVFGWLGLTPLIRLALAVAIALPMMPSMPDPVEGLAVLLAKEFVIGAALGVVLGVPFWAAEMAGSYIDVYRGASASTVISPDGTAQPLVTGALFSLALVAIFIVGGGLREVIDTVYRSVEVWPVLQLTPSTGEALLLLATGLLTRVFTLTLALAAPIVIAMFLGDLILAFTSRFAGQINVFDTSLSVKNLIFLLILPLYLYALASYYATDILDLGLFASRSGP